MKKSLHLINFIPLLSIPAAIFLSPLGRVFSPFTMWILGALLFFSFLGLKFDQLLKASRKPMQPFFISLVILIVTPLVVYPIMQRFFPEYFLGALLFMLLPAAVSSPAVAAIYGGNVAFATVNTIFSNLLSPFTIPIFLAVFASSVVKINITGMLLQLLMIIVIPFVLGLFVSQSLPSLVEKTKPHYRLINLALLFLLFFAALSPYAQELTDNLLNTHLLLAVLVAHLVLYFFSKLTVLHSTNVAEKISIESNMIFLNVGLGVVLIQNYFGPTEMLFLIFCQIFWVIMVGYFKYIK